ncbi:MAG: hypothetical protein KGL97_10295 [Alphaproteobacteria bacterium]|nr:hypothetical protein [Alphaproteobacteria bacterium]
MQTRTKSVPIPLTSVRRWLIYGIGIGVWTSGILWLLFHYFMMRDTKFDPAPDPLEPWWLAIHAGFGFVAVWMMGLLWGVHIVGGWKMRRHRVSGSSLLASLVLLVVSGYLLYYLGGDQSRAIVNLTHWVIGLALPVPFLAHFLVRNR